MLSARQTSMRLALVIAAGALPAIAMADGYPESALDEIGITLDHKGNYIYPDEQEVTAKAVKQPRHNANSAVASLQDQLSAFESDIGMGVESRKRNQDARAEDWTKSHLEDRVSAPSTTATQSSVSRDGMVVDDGNLSTIIERQSASSPATNTTTTVVGGSNDDAIEVHTHTTTTTQTTSRTPKPKVRIPPCELIDACDQYNTLKLIDATQTEKAILRAKTELAKARTELKQAECAERAGCAEEEAERERRFSAPVAAAVPQAPPMPSPSEMPAVTSIFGIDGQPLIAEVMVKGARLRVHESERIGDYSIVNITRSGVWANRHGRTVQLPFFSADSAL